MDAFLKDLRYSFRIFRQAPGFALVAILALAFGIGVNSAVFTLLNAVVLRPLPVQNASDLVALNQVFQHLENRNVHGERSYFSYPEYEAHRDQNSVFTGLAAWSMESLTLGGTEARLLNGQLTSCNYFDVLVGPIAIGHGFRPENCKSAGAGEVAVVSQRLWQNQFARDPSIVGKTIVLNGHTLTIIGVAPEGFLGGSFLGSDVWAPLSIQEQWVPNRKLMEDKNLSWLEVAGRLKPGTSLAEARANLAVIGARIDQQTPGRKSTVRVDVATMMNAPKMRTAVMGVGVTILGVVSLVLLIACANLANLLLARAAARTKEIAVRLALGAGRGRLIRQLLTESMLLSVLGGVLGLLISWAAMRVLVPMIIASLPTEGTFLSLNLSPDIRIVGFSLLLSLLTGVGFGLLPALQVSKVDLNEALKESGAVFGARRGRWMRSALVSAQVAVCLVLLITAGLLTRGLYAAQKIDPGFEMKGITTASFDLARQGYDLPRSAAFHRQLADRLMTHPGIGQVAFANPVPLSGNLHGSDAAIEGNEGNEGKDKKRFFSLATVSANYFAILGIPVVRGRAFEERDSGQHVVVISEATARSFWPDADPVGKRLRFGEDKFYTEVIGVVKDIHSTGLTEVDETFIYYPVTPDNYREMNVVVRGSADTKTLAAAIRQEAGALNANLLIETKTLESNLQFWQIPSRILASLGLVLGVVGLLLASLGIYGVVAYAVKQRTREIGIRVALGAQRGDVLGMMLAQAMRPVAVGVVVGIAGCSVMSRVMESLLFGISPVDPVVFGMVSLFLAAVAFLASYAPARKAIGVDPMVALRHQ